MNDEFMPYPPLDLIEERLFGGADAVDSPSVVETCRGSGPATGWPFAVVA